MTFSQRLFQIMLVAYPPEFRREYGPHMAQVFRDCYRAEIRTGGALRAARLWLLVFFDLVRTAPREHWDNLVKDKLIMNKLGKDILALVVCLGIIVAAFFLLSYGRKHEVSAILTFGRLLDALATTGIIANLLIFLLMVTTRFKHLVIAKWTLLVVHFGLLLVTVVVGSRVDQSFNPGSILLAYVFSFFFWLALHWLWSKGTTQLAVNSER